MATMKQELQKHTRRIDAKLRPMTTESEDESESSRTRVEELDIGGHLILHPTRRAHRELADQSSLRSQGHRGKWPYPPGAL
jgi:hypothetical protein